MESSQTLTAVLVCAVPCVSHLIVAFVFFVLGKRGMPRIAWEKSGTGRPTTTTLLKSRQTVRNADEPQEG